MRLDKLIETQLHTTRKEMKRLFLQRRVLVNGVVETNSSRNVESRLHEVVVNGVSLLTNETYLMMNKPAGVVTAVKDKERETVVDLLKEKDKQPSMYPVGRLDRDTTGLVLLTTNGQLGYELLLPEKKVTKTYRAWVNEPVTKQDVAAFAKGIVFTDGTRCLPAKLTILQHQGSHSEVSLKIKEGKFHQVKKMFLACGKKVLSLQRTAMGPLRLESTLAEGAYRSLTQEELEKLSDYFK